MSGSAQRTPFGYGTVGDHHLANTPGLAGWAGGWLVGWLAVLTGGAAWLAYSAAWYTYWWGCLDGCLAGLAKLIYICNYIYSICYLILYVIIYIILFIILYIVVLAQQHYQDMLRARKAAQPQHAAVVFIQVIIAEIARHVDEVRYG